MADTRKIIEDCGRLHREANMQAMRADGLKKATYLWFAGIWASLGDWGREIERDEQRGKDDNYHDEY